MEKSKVRQAYISRSSAGTKKFAQTLAKKLKPGDILAIYGPLGAGKTTFIQGLAAGLGYSGRVTSPTFIFVRPYKLENSKRRASNGQGKIKTLYHIDLYRIESPLDLETIGIKEFLADKKAVSAIEWPEKIEKFLPSEKTIKIHLKNTGGSTRQITLDLLR